MTEDSEMVLDQEALERAHVEAMSLALESGRFGMEQTEAAIRAYLTAIRYPQQRAVVEAAREWEAAAQQYVKALREWDFGFGTREAVLFAEETWDDAKEKLHAAVAALDKEPGHD